MDSDEVQVVSRSPYKRGESRKKIRENKNKDTPRYDKLVGVE